MKRYVKELATDRIKHLEGMREDIKQEISEKIKRIVYLCEKGYISDLEAVEKIMQR